MREIFIRILLHYNINIHQSAHQFNLIFPSLNFRSLLWRFSIIYFSSFEDFKFSILLYSKSNLKLESDGKVNSGYNILFGRGFSIDFIFSPLKNISKHQCPVIFTWVSIISSGFSPSNFSLFSHSLNFLPNPELTV